MTTRARVAVRDAGPGIPAKEQERIWERYQRVQGIEVQSGTGVGLGLGLPISRAIIEQHQGQVGVQSAPGQGSTFWFSLPLAPPEPALGRCGEDPPESSPGDGGSIGPAPAEVNPALPAQWPAPEASCPCA